MAKVKEESVRELKVGCFTFKVHFKKMSGEDHGSTCLTAKEVYVNTRFNLEIQRETLLHEILHICFDDCPLFDKTYSDREAQEEEYVRYISPKLANIIQSNSWFTDFVYGVAE